MTFHRPTLSSRRLSERLIDETASHLERLCLQRRLPISKQRRVLIEIIAQAEDHPTIEEIHTRAVARDARISRATVYRTLSLFEKEGFVRRLDFGDGLSRFEEASKASHDHLIDVKAGTVMEFSDEDVETLLRRIADRLGYRLSGYRLELYGLPTEPPAEA